MDTAFAARGEGHLEFTRIVIVTGHYGSGKTNLALNLALRFAASGERTALADLDVVNPYFRSSDFAARWEKSNLTLIAPEFAGTTLDLPALSPRVSAALNGSFDRVVIDAGGDDAGATALGTLHGRIGDCEMLYVVNAYRPLTKEPEEAVRILREIEAVSRLRGTALVNNSHLGALTSAQIVADTRGYADECARLADLPVKFTTVPRGMPRDTLGDQTPLFPVDIIVAPPWDAAQKG